MEIENERRKAAQSPSFRTLLVLRVLNYPAEYQNQRQLQGQKFTIRTT